MFACVLRVNKTTITTIITAERNGYRQKAARFILYIVTGNNSGGAARLTIRCRDWYGSEDECTLDRDDICEIIQTIYNMQSSLLQVNNCSVIVIYVSELCFYVPFMLYFYNKINKIEIKINCSEGSTNCVLLLFCDRDIETSLY